MANLTAVLYLRTKIKRKWAYRKVSEELSVLACGEYYLSWYFVSIRAKPLFSKIRSHVEVEPCKMREQLLRDVVGTRQRQPISAWQPDRRQQQRQKQKRS